tara:strand:+ start:35471 stop:35782 length:312 start_codon:yes stop_codon:yes gene_type:complete
MRNDNHIDFTFESMTTAECHECMWPVFVVDADDGEHLFVHGGTAKAFMRELDARMESHSCRSERRKGNTFTKCAPQNYQMAVVLTVMWEKRDFVNAFAWRYEL